MTSDPKVVYLNQPKPADRALRLVDEVERLAAGRLVELMRNALDSLDDTLFQRTEKEEDPATYDLYFGAMRQVRLQRQEVEADFVRRIGADFRDITGRALEEQGPLILSLVGNDELEASIAVEGMVNKARSRCGAGLDHLRQRLSALVGVSALSDDDNPLDPQQLAKAFAKAADVIEMDIRVRLMMLKLFDKHVMAQLGALYDELNVKLMKAGVLTELQTEIQTKPQPKPKAAAAATITVTVPPAGESAQAEADNGELVELLHQLLADRKYSGAPAAAGGFAAPAGPAASLNDVVSALSALQRDGEFGAPQAKASDADLKALLVQTLQRFTSDKSLGRSEDDTIDIVGMLFDVILGDPQLPVSIKALIGRLQIPVLKVALLDKAFFSSRRHPARQLINELAQAAVGWVEPAHLERDPFYRKVDYIVERVLSDFDDNVELFHELLADFLGFAEEERERIRMIEERTRQAAEGKAKVDGAKARVDQEIVQRLAEVQAAEVVHTLLRDAWSKVLFITLLKEGDESEAWQRQLTVVDRLLWSVQPKASATERKELLVEIPGLLHELREGLNGILFNPFEMTKLFKALEAEHIRCLAVAAVEMVLPGQAAPEAQTVEVAPSQPVAVAVALVAEPAPEMPLSDEAAEYAYQLQELPIGTWLEFVQPNGNRVRAKLSARLSGGRRLIFVNRAGFKLADKQLDELAAELQEQKAIILDDNLLFDKALETVIGNLRDLRAGQ